MGAALAAVLCLATPASAGQPGQAYELFQGDSAEIRGMDWYCAYLFGNGGKVYSCARMSTFGGIGVSVTGGWVRVWRYPNSRTGYKTLLYQVRR